MKIMASKMRRYTKSIIFLSHYMARSNHLDSKTMNRKSFCLDLDASSSMLSERVSKW